MAHNKVKIGNTTIMDITDASLDLASDEIASGKSGYDGNGDKISGSLQNVSGGSYTMDDTLSVVPLSGPIYIPSSGSFSVSTLSTNHTAENIKKDVQLLGVTGTYDPLANVEYISSGSLLTKTTTFYALHIPSTTTTIPTRAFYNETYLSGINLENVTSIGDYAFYGCRGLQGIIDASNTTSIGIRAFYNCSLLTSIDASSATNISARAFWGCSDLTNVDVSSAINILAGTFYNCSLLTSIDASSAISIVSSAFYGCSALTSITVKNGVSCTSVSAQSKIATVGSKTYMVEGTSSINIYEASDPNTILGTIDSSTTTYTDSDTGATFTYTASATFTITW